jgi:nitroreductase
MEKKMDVADAIANRRSVRQYAETQVPNEHLQALFEALQLAASANNQQNWEFVFAGDPELKRNLVSDCMRQRFVAECSYFIAGVVDPNLKWHMVDITIAFTNFTLQAVELGYGTCWIGAFDESKVKHRLEIPMEKKIVACMAFGKPKGRILYKRRKPVEGFIYLDRYGRSWG